MILPSLLLIHGSVCGAWVWRSWRHHLGALGWQVNVLDLRGHGRSMPAELASVTMESYIDDVLSVTRQIEAAQGVHPVLGGWGMGGMVSMMYAAEHQQPPALLLLSPSPPLEVAGRASIDLIRQAKGDVLGPEAFGIYPDDRERSRKALFDLTDDELTWFLEQSAGAEESGIAYRQSLRGISIPTGAIDCPSLVVSGDAEPEAMQSQGRAIAEHLKGDFQSVAGAGHWGIVCHDDAVAGAALGVDSWLRQKLT